MLWCDEMLLQSLMHGPHLLHSRACPHITHALCTRMQVEQIEVADFVVLNKMDLLDKQGGGKEKQVRANDS